MACSSCRSRNTSRRKKTAITNNLPPEQARDFTAPAPKASSIRAGNGRMLSLQAPLTKIKPPTGWGLHVRVGPHIHFVSGTSAEATVSRVVKTYADNGIVVASKDVWYHANLDWIKQLSKRNTYTTVLDMEALLAQEGPQPDQVAKASTVAATEYPPQDWGGKGWGILQVLLASESYTHEVFVETCTTLLMLLADKVTGCEDCHEHFMNALYVFEEEDRDREYARKWLFETMNENRKSQGRVAFPWNQAVNVNRWFSTKIETPQADV